MSDTERHSQFYVQQHAQAQNTIRRLREENRSLRGFVEFVAWGEWAEDDPGEGVTLFGHEGLARRAVAVRDRARAIIEGERRAA